MAEEKKKINYYREYENLEIPTYKIPKKKKNKGVCGWSSTRISKVNVKPKQTTENPEQIEEERGI